MRFSEIRKIVKLIENIQSRSLTESETHDAAIDHTPPWPPRNQSDTANRVKGELQSARWENFKSGFDNKCIEILHTGPGIIPEYQGSNGGIYVITPDSSDRNLTVYVRVYRPKHFTAGTTLPRKFDPSAYCNYVQQKFRNNGYNRTFINYVDMYDDDEFDRYVYNFTVTVRS